MAKLDGYNNTLVIQRNRRTGCIPSGIEWMARYMKVHEVDCISFQEDFDLEARGEKCNGFETVPPAVSMNYPQIATTPRGFENADDKIACIRATISQGLPCLVSLWQEGNGFHVVPVVEADDTSITVLWMDKATVEAQRRVFDYSEVRRLHNAVLGGRDILVWGDGSENQ